MPRLKNHRHETFAGNYVSRNYNGSAAARAAGVSPESCASVANRWLARPEIIARIQEIMAKEYEPIRASREEIIEECRKVAMFNMADLYDDEGEFIPLHLQDRSVTMSVNKIKMSALVPGRIEEMSAGKDKNKALDMMMRHHNAYADHVESGTQDINIYLSEKDLKA